MWWSENNQLLRIDVFCGTDSHPYLVWCLQ
jgi:hypothetical protein